LPQYWQTAIVRVFDFVLLFVKAGIIKISPTVQIASKIQKNQPMQPLCFVFTSVTACTNTLLLPHLLQIIKTPPINLYK
jgi:hypothetical protein